MKLIPRQPGRANKFITHHHSPQVFCYKLINTLLYTAYLWTHVLGKLLQSGQRVSELYLILAVQQHAQQGVSCTGICNHLTHTHTGNMPGLYPLVSYILFCIKYSRGIKFNKSSYLSPWYKIKVSLKELNN